MSAMELADVDVSEPSGPSLRDQVTAAVAVHTPSPDVSSVVGNAVEQRDKHVRDLHRAEEREYKAGGKDWRAASKERLRETLLGAAQEAKNATARQAETPTPAAKITEAPTPGAPQHWSTNGKAVWDQLPTQAKLEIQRAEAATRAAYDQRFGEIDAVLAPARGEYTKHGLSDTQAISRLFEWEAGMRNPATRGQFIRAAIQQYGLTPHDVAVAMGASPQHFQQQPQQHYQASPEHIAATDRQLSAFAQGRPHYEQVRETMGIMLHRFPERYVSANGVDLDKLYTAACKTEGIAARPASRPVDIASRSRPPVPAPRGNGLTVGQSLRQAMRR